MSNNLRVMQIIAGGAAGGAEVAFVDNIGAFERAREKGLWNISQHIIMRHNKNRENQIKEFGLSPTLLKFGSPYLVYQQMIY